MKSVRCHPISPLIFDIARKYHLGDKIIEQIKHLKCFTNL